MPSSSSKQHRFMEAVAHNPAFAKKAGVPQSVGKDYSAADKGKKFSGGGRAALQKVNKQDTQHGAMDMPFKSLKKFGKMKSGGEVRRFDGSEGSSVDRMPLRPFAETNATEERTVTKTVPGSVPSYPSPKKFTGSDDFKAAFAAARKDNQKAFEYGGKSYSTGFAKPSRDYGDESARMLGRAPKTETVTEQMPTPAVTGRIDKIAKRMASPEQKEENSRRFIDTVNTTVATAIPVGRAAMGVSSLLRSGNRAAADAMGKAAAGTQRQVGPVRRNMDRVKEREADAVAARKEAARERAYDDKRSSDMEDRFRKGGSVKKSMGMPSAAAAEMMARRLGAKPRSMGMAPGMKKDGMPMKDGKPAFMMDKKMNMGGMAKYAKGGGIESRGKTKGTVIKMASGGSVSSVSSASRRADGIAQRGKTRG